MQRLKALVPGVLALLLAACDNPQYLLNPASNPAVTDARQQADNVIDSVNMDPVRFGSYLAPVHGKYFHPVLPIDSRDALIYVYRPHSVWNAEELQAPGFFINGKFVYGLKDAGYFWVEIPAGTYNLGAKRPLGIIYLKSIFDVSVTVDGGKSYYFRYDEENRVHKPDNHPELVESGPLLQMPDDRGLRQIEGSVLEEPGVSFAYDKHPDWAPFDLYTKPGQPHPSRIEENPIPEASAVSADLGHVHRVWWNPLTWDSSY